MMAAAPATLAKNPKGIQVAERSLCRKVVIFIYRIFFSTTLYIDFLIEGYLISLIIEKLVKFLHSLQIDKSVLLQSLKKGQCANDF